MQAFQGICATAYTSQLGYGVVEVRDPARAAVSASEAVQGLQYMLPGLVSAGAIARRAVNGETHRRRERILRDWEDWASGLGGGMKPSLRSCRPTDVLVFLESWRKSHHGRLPPGLKAARGSGGEAVPIAPGTLQQTAGCLKALCRSLFGREGPWREDRPMGNPCDHGTVTDYLKGYEMVAFEDHDYAASGAVPLRPAKYWALVKYLREAAEGAADPGRKALLYRDLCAVAYMWEVGCRGKECGQILLSDFRYDGYDDLSCREAWVDIAAGRLEAGKRIVVESSLGTKQDKRKHPGTVVLGMASSGDEPGSVLLSALKPYARAAADLGSPLVGWLFRPAANPSCTSFKEMSLESTLLNKRVQQHLVALGLHEGETAHGIRRSATQEARAAGASLAEIAEKQHWKSVESAALYAHTTRHYRRYISATRGGPVNQVRLGCQGVKQTWPHMAGGAPAGI